MCRLSGAVRAALPFLLLASTATAYGEIKDIFTITAQCDYGRASWKMIGDVELERGAFHWRLEQPIELVDPYSGRLLGTLLEASTMLSGDPQISLGFLVQAGDIKTDFEISSALLKFPTINPAEGRASSQVTLTDLDGDGAAFGGRYDKGRAYLAQYNGYVPNGSTFTTLISDFAAPPGGSNGVAENDPFDGSFRSISGDVVDMSTQFRFSLSAFDTASGTSNFEIVPEPATVALLGLIALAALRRVAR
jgi:hypothetical protein